MRKYIIDNQIIEIRDNATKITIDYQGRYPSHVHRFKFNILRLNDHIDTLTLPEQYWLGRVYMSLQEQFKQGQLKLF